MRVKIGVLIVSLLIFSNIVFGHETLEPAVNTSAAHTTDAVAAPHTEAHASTEALGETAHEGKFDPVAIIMHHIADANEFNIIGNTNLSLPVFIYNLDKKTWFHTFSSAFQSHHGDGTVEVDGYKMEHSRIVAVDGSKIIDFSITKNVFVMLFGLVVLLIVFFALKAAYARRDGLAPKGMQGFLEPLVQFVAHDIAKENIGKNYMKFVPFLMCLFFFILINNLMGLLPIFPGSANVSGNISFTLVLGFFAFIMINFFAKKDYWGHIFFMPGVPKPLLLILSPIEFMGIFIKPIALVLRLFGNITGGHIAILSITSMVFILGEVGKSLGGSLLGGAIALPLLIFVNAMELFVAFLQAYVFTLLTSIFIGIAQEEHSGHH